MKPEETEDEKALMRVADVMTGQVICLRPDMSVESVTQLFLEHRISGAPVIDDDGRPIGVISKTDLVRESFDRDSLTEWDVTPTDDDTREGFHVQRETRATVAEVMTPVVVTLEASAPITEAARLMIEQRIHRIPVVSDTGRVVGIVSAVDLLGPIANQTPADRTA
ncbi:MAG: CBS domain-containing protein [Myxococcales bacterium]|nr:CBS domain-containing protein [Myxococcales bacterium]